MCALPTTRWRESLAVFSLMLSVFGCEGTAPIDGGAPPFVQQEPDPSLKTGPAPQVSGGSSPLALSADDNPARPDELEVRRQAMEQPAPLPEQPDQTDSLDGLPEPTRPPLPHGAPSPPSLWNGR